MNCARGRFALECAGLFVMFTVNGPRVHVEVWDGATLLDALPVSRCVARDVWTDYRGAGFAPAELVNREPMGEFAW